MNEQVHYIVVESNESEESILDWSIEHPSGCPTEEISGSNGTVYYLCAVGREITFAGLAAFGSWDEWPDSIPKRPGKYPIEFWYDTCYGSYYGSTEYDGGLRVCEPRPGGAS